MESEGEDGDDTMIMLMMAGVRVVLLIEESAYNLHSMAVTEASWLLSFNGILQQ